MGANFVITGDVGGGLTFVPVIANFDATPGFYWDKVAPKGPQTELQKIAAPGVDGVAIGRAGFREQPLVAEVIVVGSARSDCMSVLDDLDNLWDVRCTVNVPNGSTFASVDLRDYEVTDGPTDTGYGTFMIKVRIEMSEFDNR